MNQTNIYLCGDIGGTYSRLKLYMNSTNEMKDFEILYSQKYMNNEFDQFEDILTHFIRETNMESFPCISLACAGPVIDDTVQFSNISWTINKQHLEKTYNTKVYLLNDFEACGYGIQLLKENEVIILNKGVKQENGVKCCIGAGTGLGQCFIANNQCFQSEGGHCDFSPENTIEYELQNFIQTKFNKNATIENIVSGTGIVIIYEFFSIKYPKQVDNTLHEDIKKSNVKAKIISSSTDTLCIKTMELFFKHYGKEIRNSCLKWLPYGGCYVTGGLTPRFIDYLQDPYQIFMKSIFQDHLHHVISSIPIYGILTDELGERGAYVKAFQTE